MISALDMNTRLISFLSDVAERGSRCMGLLQLPSIPCSTPTVVAAALISHIARGRMAEAWSLRQPTGVESRLYLTK